MPRPALPSRAALRQYASKALNGNCCAYAEDGYTSLEELALRTLEVNGVLVIAHDFTPPLHSFIHPDKDNVIVKSAIEAGTKGIEG